MHLQSISRVSRISVSRLWWGIEAWLYSPDFYPPSSSRGRPHRFTESNLSEALCLNVRLEFWSTDCYDLCSTTPSHLVARILHQASRSDHRKPIMSLSLARWGSYWAAKPVSVPLSLTSWHNFVQSSLKLAAE